MKTQEEVLKVLRQEQERLRREWPIASLLLFGSVARGEQGPDSDID